MEVRSKDNGKLLRQSGPVLVELMGYSKLMGYGNPYVIKGDRDLAEYLLTGASSWLRTGCQACWMDSSLRASIKGYLDIVKALLATGADKDTYGGCGSTP